MVIDYLWTNCITRSLWSNVFTFKLNTMTQYPNLKKLKYTDSGNFFLIAGPCVIENTSAPYNIAEGLVKLSDKYKIPLIFKASYKKANRTSGNSFTGIDKREALEIIYEIGQEFDIPTTTDIHDVTDLIQVPSYVDILQIPAFLCRQTELIEQAAKEGKPINIKKGKFMSPEAMKY